MRRVASSIARRSPRCGSSSIGSTGSSSRAPRPRRSTPARCAAGRSSRTAIAEPSSCGKTASYRCRRSRRAKWIRPVRETASWRDSRWGCCAGGIRSRRRGSRPFAEPSPSRSPACRGSGQKIWPPSARKHRPERSLPGDRNRAAAEIDHVVGAFVAHDAARVPDHDRRGRDALQHHGGGSDGRPVADSHGPDHLAPRTEMAFFADRGRTGTDRRRGDVAHLPDRGVGADPHTGADEDRPVMSDVEAGSDPGLDVEMDSAGDADDDLQESINDPPDARKRTGLQGAAESIDEARPDAFDLQTERRFLRERDPGDVDEVAEEIGAKARRERFRFLAFERPSNGHLAHDDPPMAGTSASGGPAYSWTGEPIQPARPFGGRLRITTAFGPRTDPLGTSTGPTHSVPGPNTTRSPAEGTPLASFVPATPRVTPPKTKLSRPMRCPHRIAGWCDSIQTFSPISVQRGMRTPVA